MQRFPGSTLFAIVALALSPLVLSSELAGTWKNDKQPAWIEISFEGEPGIPSLNKVQKHAY